MSDLGIIPTSNHYATDALIMKVNSYFTFVTDTKNLTTIFRMNVSNSEIVNALRNMCGTLTAN